MTASRKTARFTTLRETWITSSLWIRVALGLVAGGHSRAALLGAAMRRRQEVVPQRGSFLLSRPRCYRALVAMAAAVATSLAVGAGGASAGRVDPPGHQDANHCFWFSGVDLNELFGVPEQFHHFLCRELSAGEHWRPFVSWITDDGVDSVYPAGYVPLRPLPLRTSSRSSR